MRLSEYVKKKNGVPIGHPNELRNHFQRSLGAKNFSTFWNYWNPIFSYYLGSFIFRPLKRILPVFLAVVLTFVVSGLIHDFVTTIIRGQISLFFSVWFLIMGSIVAISQRANYNLSSQSWLLRALINVSIISICFLLTKGLNTILHFY